MYLNYNEMNKAYKRMGPGVIRVLDDAFEKRDSELKLHPDKKALLTEDVGKSVFRALYDETWDML